jgi:N-acetyl-gamma-glutamyl-phosphate reductase
MGLRVAIAGANGYVGGELLRLLSRHPAVEIGALTAGQHAGEPLAAHHRHLPGLGERRLLSTSPDHLSDHDVVILALPHGHSAALAAEFADDVLVLDCGADFRLRDAMAWERWYGGPHAGTWPYGLPELPGARALLAEARRIAVPGCYPTAVTLALAPAMTHGLVRPEAVVVAASGTSGAGRAAQPHLTSAEVMGSLAAYGVGGGHRHTPEIAQNLSLLAGGKASVSFTPILAPLPRGLLATCSAPLAEPMTAAEVRAVYADTYADEPFLCLLPEQTSPSTGAVLGSNLVQIQVTVDAEAGRLVAVASLDNLTKGAAGTAVQCLNLALGLPETMGLPREGVSP